MQMKSLKVNIKKLCQAIEDRSPEREYYFDVGSGEIWCISQNMDDKQREGLKDKLVQEYNRYERIPHTESDEDYDDMEEFTKTVKDEHLASLLEMAINEEKAFDTFKDVLSSYPEEKSHWIRFRDEKVRQRALQWLGDMGIRVIEE